MFVKVKAGFRLPPPQVCKGRLPPLSTSIHGAVEPSPIHAVSHNGQRQNSTKFHKIPQNSTKFHSLPSALAIRSASGVDGGCCDCEYGYTQSNSRCRSPSYTTVAGLPTGHLPARPRVLAPRARGQAELCRDGDRGWDAAGQLSS